MSFMTGPPAGALVMALAALAAGLVLVTRIVVPGLALDPALGALADPLLVADDPAWVATGR